MGFIAIGCCVIKDALMVIRTGQKTEQQLIDEGLMLPRQKAGRPIASKFMRRLGK